jgi:predicted DNA binding CopG/RHH family protein
MNKTHRPQKTEDGFSIVYSLKDIPEFESEAEESAFWDNHTAAEGLISDPDTAELDRLVPPASPRTNRKRPVSLRLNEDTLARLKRLATKKHTNYQTLLKNFVNERLYEEEKREGMVP